MYYLRPCKSAPQKRQNIGVLGCEPSVKYSGLTFFFFCGFLLPFSDLPLSVTNTFFYIFSIWHWIINYPFLLLIFLFAMIDWLLASFFHVRSTTLSQTSVSILTFCACVCSRRRASINSLAQKKAAQRRDAKLTQLLAKNDEVRDADFFSPSSTSNGEWEEVIYREERRKEGMEGCMWEILQRRMLLMVRWWEFGWMGGGKLGVAEEGGKKLCERKRKEKCPVRQWLFRMACCQLLMTELK